MKSAPNKTAVLQMADQGPAESTALMLRAAGYEVFLPDDELRAELRSAQGPAGLVLSPKELSRGMGYDPPDLPECGPEVMARADLYCDVKAHRREVHDGVLRRWPNLAGKILWTRINGGRPEHVVRRGDGGEVVEDCGDEVNPPCPVLTPNLWYAVTHEECGRCGGSRESPPGEPCWECEGTGQKKVPWYGLGRYVCYPPFVRFDEYFPKRGREPWQHLSPCCLVHNAAGWGYGALLPGFRREFDLRVYGRGSPDGLVNHYDVPNLLASSLCYLHLKSSDAPGYAIYEAMAAACPVVCTRRLVWRCRMQELLIPGETCLVFDRETHDGLTFEDVNSCAEEVRGHVERLRDRGYNRELGLRGRERLKKVMWSEKREADVSSLREFFARNFGG